MVEVERFVHREKGQGIGIIPFVSTCQSKGRGLYRLSLFQYSTDTIVECTVNTLEVNVPFSEIDVNKK